MLAQAVTSWLKAGQHLDSDHQHHSTHPWHSVLWLTGVDYFSTLGYQPGIALLAAGALSPVATAILVLVTLFCALPIYAQVAQRSYAGQGSIAMLENLLSGWWGKFLVVVLIGFAATDFVITITLSAADAAQHAVENPLLHPLIGEHRMAITLLLLLLLTLVFLKGFKEAIGLASLVAIPYILLNVIVLGRAAAEVMAHPELISKWKGLLFVSGGPRDIILAAALIFPRLALGLSGFETGVSVMPLVDGEDIPARIANTRKLLAAAAILMSVLLVISSFVTAVLIPAGEYKEGGPASGRAIAYMAHKYLGSTFGTVYDVSTILILWFAGASAMAGLLSIVPRYLPRFGMAPSWVANSRPLVLLLFLVSVIVTLIFKANVEAQGGAYATGVLVLMLSAAVASALALWKERRESFSIYCWLVAFIFLYTLADNVKERPDGIIIGSVFIVLILTVSAISRYNRATELRVTSYTFVNEESEQLWHEMEGKKINLVPLRHTDPAGHLEKEKEIRQFYTVGGPLAFLNVELLDNRSEFTSPVRIGVIRAGANYDIRITYATAIANTIAYISELLDPISIFLTLTRRNLMQQSLRYLTFGEGETGLLVYSILLKYWAMTPEDDVRPFIFLMSE